MDLHQIEIFCTLMKVRNFSRTAEKLFLTQPTVSSHIKNLERELGVRLVDRLGKRVVPTEAGDVLYRRGLRLLEERDRAREEIDGLSGKVSGTLAIGGSTIPGAYILPKVIGSFKKKFPAISIQLSIDDTDRITEAVLNGALCIAVVGAAVNDPYLTTHAFLRDELVIAVPAGHPWAGKRSVSVEALRQEPLILREQGSGTLRIMAERLAAAGLQLDALNVVAVMGSSDAVRQSVKAGLGVSILSSRALEDDVRAGRLAMVRMKGVTMDRNFSVILLKGKSKSPLCKAFLDFILKEK